MSEPAKEKYFDRDLSWIRFNERVLSEALEEQNPLLERLKFSGIVSSNFDEFFMVRVVGSESDPNRYRQILDQSHDLVNRQYHSFLNQILPALETAGIRRISPQTLQPSQLEYVRNLFARELFPILTPIACRESSTFSGFSNLSLYYAVGLVKPGETEKHYAVVELPKNFSRVISLSIREEGAYSYVLLEDVIAMFAKELFVGFEVVDQGLLRLTRVAELTFDEEKDEDFAKLMEEALKKRAQNDVVRLEISGSDDMVSFFAKKLELDEMQIFRFPGWIDLKSISQLASQPGLERYRNPEWNPYALNIFEQPGDIWDALKEGDIFVHHPYESFDVVIRFISAAAEDPNVLAIKQTLYRTAGDSAVIAALEKAAAQGKQVTVLVELKARFDEEKNVQWARRLERAGAIVLYGVAGFKTHAKACLIVRREPEGIKRYLHLSTGNYNERTAKTYSDIGYFTCDEQLTKDVAAFFNVVTGFSQPVGLERIDIAPYGLRSKLRRLIVREAMRSRKEQPGLILAKMNSLVDRDIIDALYRASQAGVQIKLNVRGMCCLKPGVAGVSENIEVVSIVDMFLEHSRLFYFANGGDEELYLSSADWMPRNFDRRLEIMFRVEDKKVKKDLAELLGVYFKDNTKSWKLSPDGQYEKIQSGEGARFRVQEFLSKKAAQLRDQSGKTPDEKSLKPQKPLHKEKISKEKPIEQPSA